MSLIIFLALCILGLDFMIYVLFKLFYGDRRRAIAREVAAHRSAFNQKPPKPFLVSSSPRERRLPPSSPAGLAQMSGA